MKKLHMTAIFSIMLLIPTLIYVSPSLTTTLEYNRDLIGHGELWRLITGHFTHFSFDHLLWDTAMFAVVGGLCIHHNWKRTLITLTASIISISIYLWFFMPEISHYRGLSGIDFGFMMLYAGLLYREGMATTNRPLQWVSGIIIFCIAAKLCYELAAGVSLFVNGAGTRCLVEAHCLGALAATIIMVSDAMKTMSGHKKRPPEWMALEGSK